MVRALFFAHLRNNVLPYIIKSKEGLEMKSKYYYINLTDQERVDILHSLINKRNKLIEQGRYTNLVDEVITKITKAKKRTFIIKTI